MASATAHPVVIVYEHALLGAGIARYLLTHTGVEAIVASAHDPEEVECALASDPAVVIYELNELFEQVNLSTLAPHALLIDIGPAVTRGSSVYPDLDRIIRSVLVSRAVSHPI